jgi:hypothetical protein
MCCRLQLVASVDASTDGNSGQVRGTRDDHAVQLQSILSLLNTPTAVQHPT